MKLKYSLFRKHFNKNIGKFVHLMNIMNIQGIFLSTAIVVTSCSTRPETGAVSQVYDTETDCLNGTMIVSLDGEYGLTDTSGRVIMPVTYDNIYFLTDDVGVAFTGSLCCYFDKDGNRLGETDTDSGTSPEMLLETYSKIERDRRRQWDDILGRYEELRRYCRSDSASAGDAELMAEEIRNALKSVDGPMEKDQRARFESTYSSYKD